MSADRGASLYRRFEVGQFSCILVSWPSGGPRGGPRGARAPPAVGISKKKKKKKEAKKKKRKKEKKK